MGDLQSEEQRDIIVVLDCPALGGQVSMHQAMTSKLKYDSATSKVDIEGSLKLERTSEHLYESDKCKYNDYFE